MLQQSYKFWSDCIDSQPSLRYRISCRSKWYFCVHCIYVCCSAKCCFHFSVIWSSSQLISFSFDLLGFVLNCFCGTCSHLFCRLLFKLSCIRARHKIACTLEKWIFLSILYIHDIRFYTSDLQKSRKQNNCITHYLNVIGHVRCFETPQGKKMCNSQKKAWKVY